MFKLTFWKVFLKEKTFTFIKVPPMAVAAVIIITVGVITTVMAVIITAVMVMAPGKGSEKNLKKSSPQRKRGLPLGFLMRKGVQIGVINTPLDILPA